MSPESAKGEAERCTGDDRKRTHAVGYDAADRSCETEEDWRGHQYGSGGLGGMEEMRKAELLYRSGRRCFR